MQIRLASEEDLHESDGDDEEEDDLADELDYMNDENKDDAAQDNQQPEEKEDQTPEKNDKEEATPAPADGHASASSRQAMCMGFSIASQKKFNPK